MIATEFIATLTKSNNTPCRIPFRMQMQYNPADPLALALVFEVSESEHRPWVVSRDLLAEAMKNTGRKTGLGDVTFTCHPHINAVAVTVKSPEGTAAMMLPIQPVKAFLEEATAEAADADQFVPFVIDELIEELLS